MDSNLHFFESLNWSSSSGRHSRVYCLAPLVMEGSFAALVRPFGRFNVCRSLQSVGQKGCVKFSDMRLHDAVPVFPSEIVSGLIFIH